MAKKIFDDDSPCCRMPLLLCLLAPVPSPTVSLCSEATAYSRPRCPYCCTHPLKAPIYALYCCRLEMEAMKQSGLNNCVRMLCAYRPLEMEDIICADSARARELKSVWVWIFRSGAGRAGVFALFALRAAVENRKGVYHQFIRCTRY